MVLGLNFDKVWFLKVKVKSDLSEIFWKREEIYGDWGSYVDLGWIWGVEVEVEEGLVDVLDF